MKNCLVIVAAAVFVLGAACDVSAAAAAAADGGDDLPSIYGMQRLKINADSKAKLALILAHEDEQGFDFLRVPRSREQPIEVIVTADRSDEFKRELRENRVEFEVVVDDMSRIIREERVAHKRSRRAVSAVGPVTVGVANLTAYPRYDEIVNYMQALARLYPSFIELVVIGQSYEGRDIVGLKFSSGDSPNKPALFIDAGIHAREWIAPTTAIYAIKQLAENDANSYLYKDVDIYIVPVLNPDGYEYSHLSPETRLWRKTRSDIPFTECKGADANRNFDIMWMSVGADNRPCSSTYAGTRAFSEAESRALRDFILGRRDRIKVYLSLHSYGNYILHPWGYTTELPENEPALRCAAMSAASAIYSKRRTLYQIGSSTNVLYAASGGSDDWAMAVAGIGLAYTIELPGGVYEFDPPTSEIIPVGEETFEAFKIFVHYIRGDVCRSFQ